MPTSSPTRRGRRSARRASHPVRSTLVVLLSLGVICGGAYIAYARFGGHLHLPFTAATPSKVVAPRTAATPAPSSTPTPSAVTTAAVTTTPTPAVPPTISVAAVGDMEFDRSVATLIATQGGAAPLSKVSHLLSGADVTVGNLESCLSNKGSRVVKDVTFRGDPRAMAGLTAAGFDLVSLANNHVLDLGPVGLADEIARLDRAHIAHAGAGPDTAAAWKPAIIGRHGAKVAFLSFSWVVPPGFLAGAHRAGFASGRYDHAAVSRAIRRAKAGADYVLVSFHWGKEYTDNANSEQVRAAHAAIDAGADMVVSEHPHVIQAVERYHKGIIAYSLGDFVFDHYSRATGESFILEAELGPAGVGVARILPVYLASSGRPSVVTGSEARSILARLRAISADRGTRIDVKGSEATVAFK
jgi:hypothetical protein